MRTFGKWLATAPLMAMAVLTSIAGVALAAPPPVVSGPSPFAGCDVSGEVGTNYLNAEVEPWIAANPGNGNGLIGAWQQDRWSNGGSRSLMSAFSRNGGKTWTRAVVPGINKCSGGTGDFAFDRSSDPWVTIAPDGTSYYMSLSFFNDRPDGGGGENAMLVSRSTDGGATWGPPTALIRDTDGRVFNDKNAITADPYDSHYAYATWDRLFDTGLPEVDKAPSIGGSVPASPSGARDGVQIARERYRARREAAAAASTAVPQAEANYFEGPSYFARTTDGGLTWETAKPIWDPGIDGQTIGNQAVVLKNGSVLVFFTEFAPNGQVSIRLVKSTDHGASFGPAVDAARMNVTLTCTLTPDQNLYVRDGCTLFDVAADPVSGNLYLVWQDGRDRNIDRVAFAMSTDGGATWSRPVIINKTPWNRHKYMNQAFVPSVEVGPNSKVVVTYYDFRNDIPGAASPELADYWAITCNPWTRNCRSPSSWDNEVRLTSTSFNILNAPYAGGYFLGDYQGLVRQGPNVRALFGVATKPGLTDIVTSVIR